MNTYRTDSLFATKKAEQEVSCHHIIRVAFESGADREFDYFVPDELWPIDVGQRVEAPFGRNNKLETGFCVQSDVPAEQTYIARGRGRKLKTIVRVIDKGPLLDAGLMDLARWISSYYVCPLGQVLAAMVPAAVKKGAGAKIEKQVYLSIDNTDIEKTIGQLRGKKQKQIITILQRRNAFSSKNATELKTLLTEADCKKSPIQKLAEQGIVKLCEKTILKSLPAIPKGMTIITGKIILNDEQRKALEHIKEQIDLGGFSVTLLYGVTDSGKTELYIRAIEEVLKKAKRAIVLLPEIALTTQTIQRFSDRFKRIAVMHSGLTGAQRNVQWQKIRAGEADVVIGARSAVFAPLANLGLIIVDEEHEPSYKQDTVPRYHGRDVAVKRTQLSNAHCILGSATPSLETLLNCKTKKHFSMVRLAKRVMDLPMPQMKLVDMKASFPSHDGIELISEPLAEHLRAVLKRKEQAILLLNRRGYSNLVFCPSCKHTLQCSNCDVTLTFHKSREFDGERMRTVMGQHIDSGYAICHYCLAQTLVPQKCPLCGKGMAMIGLGSQRLEEELAKRFPETTVERVDSDSMQGKDYYHVLRDFSEGRIDILAGTQILAKGLHFPNVTVVGIISADTCLYLPDFRSNERTFQLISQVAGRAGRSAKKGTVYVQTFLANQPVIQFALKGDFDGFIKEELKHRKSCNLPPYWRLAVIVLRDRDYEKLEMAGKEMRERVDRITHREKLKATVRGPMPAVISRIQRFHRMQIVIQAPEATTMQRLFSTLRQAGPVRPTVKVALDVDPVNLL